MANPERVVLVDGTALTYRAYYAIPSNFTTSAGLHTNATYGFALMFRKILAGRTPAYGAVVFDAPGKTFRDEQFPAYKAQRPSMPGDMREQLAWIDKVVAVHRFPMLRVPGYEADDVIGTLTRQAVEAGHEVYIISGDKDFIQLVGPRVRMIDTMRDITYDEEVSRKKWGVPPSQFIDLLGLIGDKVDNVPGVPGVGQKTAQKLLEQYGTLEGVLENLHEMKGAVRSKLEENRDQALLSKQLVTIDCAVPLERRFEDLRLEPPDVTEINALYRSLEFNSLLSAEEEHTVDLGDGSYSACRSVDEVRRLVEGLPADQPVTVMPLCEMPDPVSGDLVGIAISTRAGDARYVPLAGDGALGDGAVEVLRPWLADADRPKLIHDLRDHWTLLARHGLELRGVVADLQLASFLVDPTGIIPHRLDQIVKQYLQRTLALPKAVIGSGQKQARFAEISLDEACGYACHLAAAVTEAWGPVSARLEEEGQAELMRTLCIPLAYVLGRMQLDGIRVDPEDLARMNDEFEQRKAEVEADIYRLAGHEFNIGSTQQLAEVLFEELKLPVQKRTKTGYSTAADVLERLAPQHRIAADVVRWRALAKLINTYTVVLREAVNPATGRIHCTFQQTTGASGRLITTDPDLQRTPIRTEDGKRIRQAFIPREGWRLISADWSQIELRILAHFTRDPLMVEAFREGLDLHRRTASQIFEVPVDQVTAQQRNTGKTVNFATIYGQGATALGQSLGIPRKEAAAIIERYFRAYSGVRAWIDRTVAEAHEKKHVTTLLGRRRYIPEITSNNFTDRAYGERIAANTPIQGSAADICKLAMLRIAERLEGMQTRMLLQIHDELLFEAPPAEVEAAVAIIRDCMENAWPLEVPLVVDVGVGGSWAEAH